MMKKINSSFILYFLSLMIILSCNGNDNKGLSDLQKIKHNNKKTYSVVKMDSTQAILAITQQKIQELLDLSTLYSSGNKDTEIDSLIYKQIEGYYTQPDSTKINIVISELDSLKVKNVKINNLNIYKHIKENDTTDIVNFEVEYFNNNKSSIGTFQKQALYVLKKSPVQFTKEFKFYFIDVYSEKEITPSAETK